MTEDLSRKNGRKRRNGIVVSDKMQKTIVVRVGNKFRHPRLLKVIEKFQKFKVHDEKNEAKSGDLVEIEETRPLSKEKRWRLIAVIRKGAELPKEAEAEVK